MPEIKVLLVDDHQLFRLGLKKMLESYKHIEIVGEASTGAEAIKTSEQILPDVVLMDLQLPGEVTGTEAIRRIKGLLPKIEIIALTMYQDDEHLFEAIKAGASGYLVKNAPVDELVRNIEAVSRGESLLDPGISRRILNEFSSFGKEKREETYFEKLTQREMQILKLIADGMANKEIARQLLVSEKTVKNHITNIYQKMHVNARTQAVVQAVKLKLLEL